MPRMKNHTLPVELLIFDFDGTLADSLPLALAAVQKMLVKLGYPVKTIAEITTHVGWGEKQLISGSIGSTDEQKVKLARETYFNLYREELKNILLFPHLKETLEHFRDKTMIVLSNKRLEFIQLILEQHKVARLFKEILGEDNSACLKPDPGVVLELLKKYQVKPERALLVGDMTIDIETGKNAGIKTCAVTYGFDNRTKLAAAQPDLLIDDIFELKELI